MRFYTDYPIIEFGDIPGELAPIREVQYIEWDTNKYVTVKIKNDTQCIQTKIKSGYIYTKPGRIGEVSSIKLPFTYISMYE